MTIASDLPIAGRRAVRWLTVAPFALALVSALLLTTSWIRWHPARAGDTFVWVSTNVHNLSVAPVRSFVLSALFLTDGHWLVNAGMLAAVLVPLELRAGTRRSLAVFASAHVLATVATEGWVWLAVRSGGLPASAEFQQDVGISYGLYGVAGAVLIFLPRRWRGWAVTALAGYLAAPMISDPDMTGAGHLISLAIGICWWPLLARMPRRQLSACRPAGAGPGAGRPAGPPS